jgi:hypothetical protein
MAPVAAMEALKARRAELRVLMLPTKRQERRAEPEMAE